MYTYKGVNMPTKKKIKKKSTRKPLKKKIAAKCKPVRKKSAKKKLNIAEVHWGYPPIIGGVETHMAMMLPIMAEMGHKVHLLTGAAEGHKVKYNENGVHIRRTPFMDLNWLFKRGLMGLEAEITKMYTSFINESKPDVMHVHNMHYFSKAHIKILDDMCHSKGIPLVLTAHNVWDDVLYLDLTRDIKWDHIIAVSHYIRKELIGAGCSDKKVTTLHHGVDTDTFKPNASTKATYKKYPQIKGRPIIFHPARMGMAKGCDVTIKAFNIVRRTFPDAMLVMAGSKNIIDWGSTQQKDIAYFVNLVKHYKLEDHILIDAYALEEMPGLYAASDVVVYPSTAMEPFGLTMLESLATEKPIIVTRAGGMPEIISDGINGFVIPLKDFEELAGTIIRLLGDKSLRDRFGRTGHQMINSYYTKQNITDNTIDIFRQVI